MNASLTRRIVARVMVAVLLGGALGYAFGWSVAKDAARGKSLTLKEYVADFESHKQHLINGQVPMWVAIVTLILMLVVLFGIYELLAVAVDRALVALDRRRNDSTQPGTPPPW
ncbi:MAG: hypothetical protein ABR537_03795 [Gemmatimonadales bacterium]